MIRFLTSASREAPPAGSLAALRNWGRHSGGGQPHWLGAECGHESEYGSAGCLQSEVCVCVFSPCEAGRGEAVRAFPVVQLKQLETSLHSTELSRYGAKFSHCQHAPGRRRRVSEREWQWEREGKRGERRDREGGYKEREVKKEGGKERKGGKDKRGGR